MEKDMPPPPHMPQENPLPAFSDDITTTFSDEHPSPLLSPSFSLDSAPESDASSSTLVVSDVSSGSEPIVTRKTWPRVRMWPAADEIALLDAAVALRQKHGQLPSPNDLAAELRGRLLSDDRLAADQIAKRLIALRSRYINAAFQLSRGIIPVKDDDLRIYKLSKLIWDGTRKGKKEKKVRVVDTRQDPMVFGELARLHPCLAAEVEAIEAGCAAAAGMLKRAFGRIGDNKAAQLEAKVKRQRVAEAKASAELDSLRRTVASALLKLK
ncbi:uncharacterized protein LOC133895382 [Phragmites australis]|uniref:uncharacterized protein LOC133895382 n=1 Tax=Phragmites australis TaxID=29695 RepID=UPI002D7703F5|nr:uncharacterized protein LOC133895382 [Phragmites australis]XP_062191632.1 uncharacterized protein LOC133895382 [Phragmites australis]XP_062191633.1 uncharacterized protein LOC133895382 [Phragmites australis]XP_062191634.1 uncharacterized protein LOC133895382 [Phragmites australis]XP_062191635.1 uncharacterized protein LOC133895382 [Phragmites australis]XP_062191636.1 uncharacterized protein LOC133895382 [Phragmites australis]XP_062191637.1 uncharacterized protein LOC133895382 [Phragmites a